MSVFASLACSTWLAGIHHDVEVEKGSLTFSRVAQSMQAPDVVKMKGSGSRVLPLHSTKPPLSLPVLISFVVAAAQALQLGWVLLLVA